MGIEKGWRLVVLILLFSLKHLSNHYLGGVEK